MVHCESMHLTTCWRESQWVWWYQNFQRLNMGEFFKSLNLCHNNVYPLPNLQFWGSCLDASLLHRCSEWQMHRCTVWTRKVIFQMPGNWNKAHYYPDPHLQLWKIPSSLCKAVQHGTFNQPSAAVHQTIWANFQRCLHWLWMVIKKRNNNAKILNCVYICRFINKYTEFFSVAEFLTSLQSSSPQGHALWCLLPWCSLNSQPGQFESLKIYLITSTKWSVALIATLCSAKIQLA